MWDPEADLTLSFVTTQSLISLLATIILAFTLYHVSRQVQKQRADARFATKHHCLPPVRLRTKWPLGLDLIWTAFQNAKDQTILQFFIQVIEDTAPTFEQSLLGSSGINTVDPRNIESILATQFNGFGFGDRPPTFAPLLGDGIFTQQGRAWKHSREMLRPLFSTNRVNNFTQIQEHVERLISCIPENEVVDFQPLFFRLTLDTTTYLLFGRSINSLGKQSAQSEAFAESFRVAQYFLAQRGRLGSLYWLIGGKDFRNACATVHEFVDGAIQDSLATENLNKTSKLETASNYVFLDALIKETQDPKILRDQLLNILLAGRDTTACCLAWTFRLLAQHQSVLLKLRDEIKATTGVGSKARHPDRKDLKKMIYLGFVLKEVLRLYPSVPINSRSALETTTLPVGGGPDGTSPILIRKGSAVGYCVYAMHRQKDLYGSDAEKFRPERWDPDENNEVSLKNIGWGYLPFNGGPRICLGQEFALLEASYVIVRLLQTFEQFDYESQHKFVELGKERQDVTLVVASADGCQIRVRKYGS